jgi:hypothetical protein
VATPAIARSPYAVLSRAAWAGVNVIPQGSPVGVPGSSVSRHPIRPTAMPMAIAGAKRSPVEAR